MAHQMLKAYSFLFYFLSIIASFFLGMTYAGIVEAGKNQGLAGGAIVFGYGIIAAFFGLIISLFVASKTNRKTIFRGNIILALCIAGFYSYYHIKYLERQKTKAQDKQKIEKPKQQTTPVSEPTAMLYAREKHFQANEKSSLGMFSPNFNEQSVLYFYNTPNLEKSIQEHAPLDSITFKKSKYGDIDIQTAPPWLEPEHLKLDYGILLFKAHSVTEDFIEVIVNKTNQQTAFVSKSSGYMQFWPEFLLHVHSVEFPNPENETIYVKPLNHAGTVKATYSFMKPLRIKEEWMYVELQDDSFSSVGKGWIKWRDNNGLLIRYSLIS